jgi:fructokinase
MALFGAIEAGGTKFRCAIAETPLRILDEAAFPTTTPADTLALVAGFFARATVGREKIQALGVGSFGPLDLDSSSPAFGSIVRTPKPNWSGFNFRAALEEMLSCPVAIDTDVNASGLGEALFGAGVGHKSLAYITIGTGIGGGLIREGRPLHGFSHAEMGHIKPRRAAEDGFVGICPYHGDCLEGLASGAAVFARAGKHLADVAPADPLWRILPDYIAQLCANLLLIAAPDRIVLGGGVMSSNPALFGPIRRAVEAQLAGYCGTLPLDEMIVPPGLGDGAGLAGAVAMAQGTNP